MKTSTKSLSFYAFVISVFFMSVPAIEAAEKIEKKEWALLTFLNGFNNLDSFGHADMNEMEKIGSSARVHVVSQWASLKTKDVRRVYLGKDADPVNVTSPVVENLGQADMGDYRTLVDFVKWAVLRYPAKRYFVNVWNHGTGWHFQGGDGSGGVGTRDVSYDDLSGNKITTEQLGVALEEIARETGQKIDIFGSDSCLMAMAEVVGQMKGSVDHFIGSEEVEPAAGWPYDKLLEKWNEGASKSASDVSKILTKVYVESYTNGRATTLSGIDLGKYSELAQSVRDLGEAIKSEPRTSRQKILQAVTHSQSYTNDDYKDLGDFVDQLAKDSTITIRPEVLVGVKTALKEFVVANRTSASMARSQGISIWFPDATWQYDSFKARYRALTFNQDTDWIDAIAATLSSASPI